MNMGKEPFIEKVLLKEREPGRQSERAWILSGLARLSKVPLVTKLHPWLRSDKTDMRWLPINEDIALPESAPAPLALLDRLIEEASHRVVFEACGCRTASQCRRHPVEIGCLLMGDSAVESPPSVSREVGVEEAKQHARRAVEAGLVPFVGKARFDNYVFGIKERARLLTTCFCCDCCCITRNERHIPRRHLDRIFPRLDGVRIEVNERCDGCGDCVELCYVGAIKMKDGRAVMSERCRACGRCATICPPHAVEVHIDDSRFLDMAYERIRAHVKHD